MFIDAVQTIHLIWSLLSLIQTEDEKKQFMGLVRPTSASRIKIETLEDWKTPIRGPLFCRRVGWEKPYWIAALWSLLFVKFQYYPTETLKNYLNFVYFSKCCCTEINRVIVKRFWLSYPRNGPSTRTRHQFRLMSSSTSQSDAESMRVSRKTLVKCFALFRGFHSKSFKYCAILCEKFNSIKRPVVLRRAALHRHSMGASNEVT